VVYTFASTIRQQQRINKADDVFFAKRRSVGELIFILEHQHNYWVSLFCSVWLILIV